MHFQSYILCVFYAACLNLLFQAQGDEVTDTVVATNGGVFEESETALDQLQNVSSVENFLALLKKEDGQSVSFSDVFSSYNNDTNKFVVMDGGGQLAEPDDCSPRMTTVKLNFNFTDPKIVYYPRCTKIERCGGGCSSSSVECVPSYTERVNLKVFKAEVPSTDATQFIYKGFSSVVVERHVFCRVQCSLSVAKCGPKKNFIPAQCACKCPQTLRCAPPKVWDPDDCSCACAIKTECCSNGQQCGLVFDTETCLCALNADGLRISGNTNHSEDQIRDFWSSLENGGVPPSAADTQNQTSSPATFTTSTITTTATTTITTTTTTPAPANAVSNVSTIISTVTSDPCASRNCPANFIKVYNSTTNSCLCRAGAFARNRPRRRASAP